MHLSHFTTVRKILACFFCHAEILFIYTVLLQPLFDRQFLSKE